MKDLAQVAIGLQNQNQNPHEVLLNPDKRSTFFSHLPKASFFLRDWQAFIEVLTPLPKVRQNKTQRQGLQSLALVLDTQSLLIQIILPAQSIYRADWQPGTYRIPVVGWQDDIIDAGEVNIPELTQVVKSVSEIWKWELHDIDHICLQEWTVEGVMPDAPYLIFDAWTGDRCFPNPNIAGSHEVFCFITSTTTLSFDNQVDLLEESVPCSISGWQGQRLRLANSSATLSFYSNENVSNLRWLEDDLQPTLRGLKLKDKQTIYLKAPVLWYPPNESSTQVTVQLYDLTDSEASVRSNRSTNLLSATRWQSLELEEWINAQSGSYKIEIQQGENLWSERFHLQAPYHVDAEELADSQPVHVRDLSGNPVALPMEAELLNQFWMTTLQIVGLWTLEPVVLILCNGEQRVTRSVQANSEGILKIELSTLHDLLMIAEYVCLEYQRVGKTPQKLIEFALKIHQIMWTWEDRNLNIFSLKTDQIYTLSCWNLLTPNHPKTELVLSSGRSIIYPLNLPPGIYFIQLKCNGQVTASLGWWCKSDRYDFSEILNQEPHLTDYGYALLDDELIYDFLVAIKGIDWDLNWITLITHELEQGSYHFPEWLDIKALLAKLRAIQSPIIGEWYLVNIAEGKRGDFQEKLRREILQKDLWSLVLGCKSHPLRKNKNQVLINLSEISTARSYISQIEHFDWISRQPIDAELLALAEEVNYVG